MDQANKLSDRELRFIVGREQELTVFEKILEKIKKNRDMGLFHVYGTGGVGKSSFLRLCRQKAQQLGAVYLQLHSRDFVHTEQGIGAALLSQIGLSAENEKDPLRYFGEQIAQQAGERVVVLAIDTFEEMQDMENWLRDRLIPMLPERLLLLTASRFPLRGGWLWSPVWRERICQLPLKQLDRDECIKYLDFCGITDDFQIEQIWRRTNGHPLAISLAAAFNFSESTVPIKGGDLFKQLAALWLQEIPDRELNRFVEAASVLRVFDQERLSSVLEEEVPTDLFDRLIELSFVRRTERGWQLHDLMRKSMNNRLKERRPKRHLELTKRCIEYYAKAIIESKDRSAIEWEVGELLHYADIDVLRALTFGDDLSHYWEAVTETTLRDALAYAKWRETNTQPVSGYEIDPVTGNSFQFNYSKEQVRYNAAPLDLELLFKMEPSSIKLLRDPNDQACGLAIWIPIHAGTLPWLQKDPLFIPYLHTLTEKESSLLVTPREHPAGWFLRSFDFVDVLSPKVRAAAIRLIYSYLCRGGLTICTPYDSEIGRKSYTGFGFRHVKGADHYNYDGLTLTPTYALDTRSEKLAAFLMELFQRSGIDLVNIVNFPIEQQLSEPALVGLLSDREHDVAKEVAAGYSNAEIAARLFVSESTVKKHMKSIYSKLGIHNRAQLTAKLIGKS
ncbi:LuxR family transcriptional regulator [Paenibacillus sp. H1-7]|uniref:LuxR family transcriptional regulator n=1 Tax=Paenibacillus sp. H1-7 TaxID=2282849 RepID=UPI001EF78EDB|nr:LuxR family transcriptional regulator [Paenibacillus sp. H1-7]ULL14985.1 LuxR family transcriptional regulator [Paenibacillus sp. H1-7]